MHKVASQGQGRVGLHHVYYGSIANRLRGATYFAVTETVCQPVAPFGAGGA
jgi:hypothetical protein